MTLLFRSLITVFGVVIVLIGGGIALSGAEPVGALFGRLFAPLLPVGSLPFVGSGVDADSELRFYSVFFAAYGAVLIWLARVFPRHQEIFPLAIGLFFLGGLARGLSVLMSGAPHPFFQILLALELALPPLFLLLFKRAQR